MITHGTFYYFHDDGYYKDDNGDRYDMVCVIDNSWDKTLKYVNDCHRSGHPERKPIIPKKVLKWECGVSKLIYG
jgi:hypothetical protein